MRGRCPAGEACKEGLKRRRLSPTILRGLSLRVIRSATLPNVRTPYLHLRLPVIIRRVQRGEAKLAVNMAKLKTYLALPQNVLSFSSRGLLTFITGCIY